MPIRIQAPTSCINATIEYQKLYHRVDSVIESSLREIMRSKNFALINLSLNFCDTTIYDKKDF